MDNIEIRQSKERVGIKKTLDSIKYNNVEVKHCYCIIDHCWGEQKEIFLIALNNNMKIHELLAVMNYVTSETFPCIEDLKLFESAICFVENIETYKHYYSYPFHVALEDHLQQIINDKVRGLQYSVTKEHIERMKEIKKKARTGFLKFRDQAKRVIWKNNGVVINN